MRKCDKDEAGFGISDINAPSEEMPNPRQDVQSGNPRCRTFAAWLFAWAAGLFTACDLFAPPLHGHREIATALRPLLDVGYAEPDYPTYHAAFLSFQDVVREQRDATPHEMRPFVARILGYLQVADEVLAWQDRQAGNERSGDPAEPPHLGLWTERYPFLNAAVGARLDAPHAFDAATAVQMLFEKTDQTLVAMQIKNKPI